MSSSIIGTSILTLPLSIDASKITTGTLDTAVVPDLDASKITTGTLDTARIDADSVLDATTSAHTIPAASAQKILSQANRTLTAGNGLSGGGTLAANRTFTLGTPGTITTTSTNNVTATSHTHALTFSVTNSGLNDTNFVVGHTVNARATNIPNRNSSSSVYLANLNDRYTTASNEGAVLAGTWRASGRTSLDAFTLYRRVS